MSPFRVPAPYETSNSPGEALLSGSITLDTPEFDVHKKVKSPAVPGPSSSCQKKKGERIPIPIGDLYQTAPNGSVKLKECYTCFRKTLKRVVAYIGEVVVPDTAGDEDRNGSASGGLNGEGTLDSRSGSPHPAVIKARFDEALSALRSLSSSVCVEAAMDRDVMETYSELVSRLKKWGLLDDDEDDSESEDEGEEVPDGFVLVSICNVLEGAGEGFLEMVAGVVAENQQEEEVSHCGTGF